MKTHPINNMLVPTQKKAVDLFCGCGGISAGLKMAGYDIVAGLDIEKKFIATFAHNFPKAKALTQNLLALEPSEFARQVGLQQGELDMMVGGPPCQGFSKNVPRKYRYLEDPKNLLVKRYLDYAEYLRPRVLIMENVAEMKNGFDGQYTDEVLHRLQMAGYTVTHAVLNAADYGVPQRRRRAFFFANLESVSFRVPEPTHILPSLKTLFSDVAPHVTVWDSIGDLPSLAHGEGHDLTSYATKPQSDYQRFVRNESGKVSNHVSRVLQPVQYERLSSLQPGQVHKDLPVHLQVKGGYSGAYGRLTKDMIAPTITRWVFHPGSGRWGHPVDARVISIREVARIQGFPDSYEFIGSYNQQAGQLGNAVPPILAYRIVSDLDRQLSDHKDSSNSIRQSKEIFSSASGKRKETA